MTLETRAFDGTPEELSDFVVSTWKASYAGAMAVPNWSADYFRWQLRLAETDSARRVTAVYSGSELAGVLIFAPYNFELHGKRGRGAHSSWLTVSPDFRRQGVGRALQLGTIKACQDDGVDFRIGYVYQGSTRSQGPLFWLKKGKPLKNQSLGPRVGFWVRVLDAKGAIAWNLSRLDRVLTRFAAPFIPAPKNKPGTDGVNFREFAPADIESCVEVANEASHRCDVRIIWDAETLGQHLQGFGKCVVAVRDNSVVGLIGYHNLVITGREDAPIGIVDLICVDRLNSTNRSRLLDSAMSAMKDSGAVVALKLRTGDYPSGFFARFGWVPRLSDSQMVFTWCGEPQDASNIRRCHVLWR